MDFIKKSIGAFSIDSIEKYNNGEYIFYSIQHADQFGEYEPEQFNFVLTKNKINLKTISLKQIKEIIPKYKFCCCHSKTCVCDFIVRYKSHDSNGIYPWVWCDLETDHNTATPYNSIIILKILVFVDFSSYYNGYYIEPMNFKYDKEVEDDFTIYGTDKTENLDGKSYSDIQQITSQTSGSQEFDNLINSPCYINVNYNKQTKSVTYEKSSSSPLELEPKILETNTREESNNFDYENLVKEIGRWSRKPDGSYKDIRVLLSSLQQVLWENAQWEPVEFSKLMSDIELMKKTYRKAIILCHPDKHHKENEKHKNRVHLIFMAINESHNKCNAFCAH